jgi:sugar lactone lactonase YvrE
VAVWRGAAVHRYGPDGRLDEVIDLPVELVTACAFGGPGEVVGDDAHAAAPRRGYSAHVSHRAAQAISWRWAALS